MHARSPRDLRIGGFTLATIVRAENRVNTGAWSVPSFPECSHMTTFIASIPPALVIARSSAHIASIRDREVP